MKARDWLLPVVVIAAALAAAAWYFYPAKTPPADTAAVPANTAASAAAAKAPTEPQYPVPEPQTDTYRPATPVTLASSDGPVRKSLIDLLGASTVDDDVVAQDIIRRFVVMVDNLPEHSLPLRIRAIRKVEGNVRTQGSGDALTLAPANAMRYAAFAKAVQLVDAKSAAALYFHFYPLFQSAYAELGRSGYFNDRLIVVIDHLLETPELAQPLALVRPNVLYQYADPEIEARSAGQKAMIRIGPENAAIVETKLRELRVELVTHGRKAESR